MANKKITIENLAVMIKKALMARQQEDRLLVWKKGLIRLKFELIKLMCGLET